MDEEIDDILCDICGKTCCVEIIDIDVDRELKMISVIDDSKIQSQRKDFEYMKLSASWGYNSKKDWEYWEAQVCEKCVDEHLSKLVKFKIGPEKFR